MKYLVTIIIMILLNTAIFPQAPDIQWTKTFGDSLADRGYSVQQTSDGGYIITGYTYSFNVDDRDVWLIKTDANGDTLWTKTFGDSGCVADEGYSVQQTTEGGYVITGVTNMNCGNNGSFFGGEAWLIKTNTNGDTLWSKTFTKSLGGNDWGNSVQQTSDGGYIIAGVSGRFRGGLIPSRAVEGDVWLIKTDAIGDTLWTKTFGDSLNDFCYSVQQTSDGGYIIAGKTNSHDNGSSDVWLIKTDSTGNTLWTKTFPGGCGNSVQQTTDGGYIIAGSTESFGANDSDVLLIRTNTNGDILWTKTIGGSSEDFGYSVQQTSDGGYIVTGYTDLGGGDVLLIKIAPDVTAIDETPQTVINDYRLQQNYPNPFNPATTINYSIPKEGLVTLKVYNVLGEEVYILVNEIKQVGNYETNFDASSLSSGVYFYRLQVYPANGGVGDPSTSSGQSFVETKKMLLLK